MKYRAAVWLLLFISFILFNSYPLGQVAQSSVAVSGVSLNRSSLVLNRNSTQTLTASISPAEATNRAVRWVSSDTGVVQVSSEGGLSARVRAMAAGTATVTVITEDGDKRASCQVRVVVPVERVSLDVSETTLIRGDTKQFRASIFPVDATNQAVRWASSDDERVEIISRDGLVAEIEALAPGTATLTVVAEDGDKRASAQVEVIVLVERVQLDLYETTLSLEEERALDAWVMPRDATDQRIRWESSDNSVVFVDDRGVITGRSPGQARVVARSAENSTIYAYCTVTVGEDNGAPPGEQVDQNSNREDEIIEVDEGLTGEELTIDDDLAAGEAGSDGEPGSFVTMAIIAGAAVVLAALVGVFFLVRGRSRQH